MPLPARKVPGWFYRKQFRRIARNQRRAIVHSMEIKHRIPMKEAMKNPFYNYTRANYRSWNLKEISLALERGIELRHISEATARKVIEYISFEGSKTAIKYLTGKQIILYDRKTKLDKILEEQGMKEMEIPRVVVIDKKTKNRVVVDFHKKAAQMVIYRSKPKK